MFQSKQISSSKFKILGTNNFDFALLVFSISNLAHHVPQFLNSDIEGFKMKRKSEIDQICVKKDAKAS